MSLAVLVILAIVVLALPWLVMPRRPGPRLEVHGLLRVLWWLNAAYCALLHRLETERAPLPEHGAAILISNHTCGIDHMLIQAGCRDRVLGFMIAKEFYEYWLCRPFCRLLGCIPVRRDGRDVAATRTALRALEEGRVLPIFPEGRIHPTSGREIYEGKPGAAFIALHARVPVIPAYISGTPLTDDVFKALRTPSNARVVYGPPIELGDEWEADVHDKEVLNRVTRRLMSAIEALRARVLAERNGVPLAPCPPSQADARLSEDGSEPVPGSGAAAIKA